MYARAPGAADRTRGGLDIGLPGAGERGDRRPADLTRDPRHGLGFASRGGREARLEHVDAEIGDRVSRPHLGGLTEARTGCLLAVAQRRIEHRDRSSPFCLRHL